jgi:hypothetical protein
MLGQPGDCSPHQVIGRGLPLLFKQGCHGPKQDTPPEVTPSASDPQELTAELKDYAAKLGISATAVTAFDANYTFAEHVGKAVGEHVVVCVLEQNYGATQRVPAYRSEQAALST